MISFILGRSVLVTGVEDDPDGMLRAYVGPRYRNQFVLIENESDKDELRRAWAMGGHVVIPSPDPDQVFTERETP